MAVCNSQVGSLQDDPDISIIDPSLDHDAHPYVPIITRLKQANHSSENRKIFDHQNLCSSVYENRHQQPIHGEDTSGYIIVHHDPLEIAKRLEEILLSYIRDLKQESYCQLDCDKQLVTRMMDLIRPAYTDDQAKSKQLDKIIEEIGVLHDKRHIEQKEKVQHLQMEVSRLTQMLFTDNSEKTVQLEQSQMNSMFTILPHDYSSMNPEQWTEIEDDAKKLHDLVESQRDKINVIASLISQTEAIPSRPIEPSPLISTPNPNVVPSNKPNDEMHKQPAQETANTRAINSLVNKVKNMTQSITQPQSINTITSDTTLINHSPGTSPTQSLYTLTLSTITPTMTQLPSEEPSEKPEPIVELKKPIDEIPHKPINILIPEPEPSSVPKPTDIQRPPSPVLSTPSENSTAEAKKCPVCHFKFSAAANDFEMYDHIERCLFPTNNPPPPPKNYECPNCKSKFSGYSDKDYLQHLHDCYNREF